jgi:septal ring factor EnvC (AmiA/AmiB activator)
MEIKFMKKLWVKITILAGFIVGILCFVLGFKKKEKKPVEIDENKKKIDVLKSTINRQKLERESAKRDLNKIKSIADGRSKKVKDAKKKVIEVDKKINDLEQQLKDAGINI